MYDNQLDEEARWPHRAAILGCDPDPDADALIAAFLNSPAAQAAIREVDATDADIIERRRWESETAAIFARRKHVTRPTCRPRRVRHRTGRRRFRRRSRARSPGSSRDDDGPGEPDGVAGPPIPDCLRRERWS